MSKGYRRTNGVVRRRRSRNEWKEEYWRLVSAEAELEQSRARYEALYDSAPVGYATLDPQGRIQELNSTGANLLGRSRRTLLGGCLLALVSPADRRRALQYFVGVRHGRSPATIDLYFQRPDSSQLLLHLVSQPGSGEHQAGATIGTIFSDVTEGRRQEVEFNQSRAEFAAVTASAMDAIISVGPDLRVLAFNAAAEAMFVCPAAQALGQSVCRLLAEPCREAAETSLLAFSHTSAAWERLGRLDELWGLRRDGKEFCLEAAISQADVAGEKRLTLVMRDITRRKQAQAEVLRINEQLERRVRERTAQLEQANRELEREVAQRRQLQHQLLAVSDREQQRIGQDLHDGVGQVLTGLMLLNDTSVRRLGPNPAQSAASLRMAVLLAEARLQVQQISRGLHPVPATATGLMSSLDGLAENISRVHGVECVFHCPQPVLVSDNLLATHLFRIAQEAIHNALRHGPSKRVQLKLAAQDGRLLLSVRDDGRGLRKVQVSGASGLGLQIMKSRAEAIGATLRFRRLRPRGTLVTCRAPGAEPALCTVEN